MAVLGHIGLKCDFTALFKYVLLKINGKTSKIFADLHFFEAAHLAVFIFVWLP